MASQREQFNMPLRVFMYTLDQVSLMTNINLQNLKDNHLHYAQRSIGPRPLGKMLARNIAVDGDKPDWRIAEQEFIRWLRYKGFRIYNRTTLYS